MSDVRYEDVCAVLDEAAARGVSAEELRTLLKPDKWCRYSDIPWGAPFRVRGLSIAPDIVFVKLINGDLLNFGTSGDSVICVSPTVVDQMGATFIEEEFPKCCA